MAIIEINNLTKEYRLGQLQSVKTTALNVLYKLKGEKPLTRENLKALDNINLKIEAGEVVGIIGNNGAGKSTLLKMLAHISVPTIGEVKVNGSVAPLIEVGAGLHPELTGRENIFLNASILGVPRSEIKEKMNAIIEFAELSEFIDTPVKRYSSGMTVRLGFSIATSVDADVLIVDEVLAVGDLAFQRKCFDRMEDLIKRQSKTVLLVSHNIRQVERLCNRVIILDNGKVIADGKAKTICDLFYEKSDEKIKNVITSVATLKRNHQTTGDVELLGIHMLDEQGKNVDHVVYKSDICFSVNYKINSILTNPEFGIGIHTTDFFYLTTKHSKELTKQMVINPGVYNINCTINKFPILPGVYAIRLGVSAGGSAATVFYGENVFHFQVKLEDGSLCQEMREGFIGIEAEWQVDQIHGGS